MEQVAVLAERGKGETLEFKRSTGELKEGMRTLCAFLNGSGGTVLFGVRFLPSGYIALHRVAHDLTEGQREILISWRISWNKLVSRLEWAERNGFFPMDPMNTAGIGQRWITPFRFIPSVHAGR